MNPDGANEPPVLWIPKQHLGVHKRFENRRQAFPGTLYG